MGENNKDGTVRDVCQVKLGGVRRIGSAATLYRPSRRLPPPPATAARYPPRQPLNLWRCDNVDAAFCMLDCCRIHSRFSPSLSRRRLYIRLPHALSPSRALPNAYAGINELHHHRHRNHHHRRHCRTVVLAAAVIYYLLKLVWLALLPM